MKVLNRRLLSSTKCNNFPVLGSNWEVRATSNRGEARGMKVKLCPTEEAAYPTLAYENKKRVLNLQDG